jgi:hypothetical protein
VNGDGQFSSDAAAGERLAMEAHGDDYAAGVLFTVQRPPDRSYVFRFADEAWNPPEPGGLVPGVTQGISYGHWAVRNRPEGGEGRVVSGNLRPLSFNSSSMWCADT